MPEAIYPWRLDTNARYREVVKMVFGLSTASLLLPVFFARDFLSVPSTVALKDVFSTSIYWSWALLGLSIIFGLAFHYFSAAWIRLAWGQPANFIWFSVKDKIVDRSLDIAFWACILSFIGGIILLLYFYSFFTYL